MRFYLDQNRMINLSASGAALLIFFFISIARAVPQIQTDIDLRVAAKLRSQGADWAQIDVRGRDVYLTGTASSVIDSDTLYRSVRTVTGVRRVHNDVTFKTTPLDLPIAQNETLAENGEPLDNLVTPFNTQLTLTKNGLLLLSGNAPNASQQSMLNAYIVERWPSETFITSLKPASGAPDRWLTVMARSFDALILLQEGSLELKDQSLIVRGIARERTQLAKVRAFLTEQLPDSVDYDFELATPQALALSSKESDDK